MWPNPQLPTKKSLLKKSLMENFIFLCRDAKAFLDVWEPLLKLLENSSENMLIWSPFL